MKHNYDLTTGSPVKVLPLFALYMVVTVKIVLDGVLKGAGAMAQFTADTFADLLLRVVLSYLLPLWFGYRGIWMAFPIGWILGTGMAIAFYLSGKWKRVSIWKGVGENR